MYHQCSRLICCHLTKNQNFSTLSANGFSQKTVPKFKKFKTSKNHICLSIFNYKKLSHIIIYAMIIIIIIVNQISKTHQKAKNKNKVLHYARAWDANALTIIHVLLDMVDQSFLNSFYLNLDIGLKTYFSLFFFFYFLWRNFFFVYSFMHFFISHCTHF